MLLSSVVKYKFWVEELRITKEKEALEESYLFFEITNLKITYTDHNELVNKWVFVLRTILNYYKKIIYSICRWIFTVNVVGDIKPCQHRWGT